MKKSNHNLLHYLFMVVYLEIINIVWIVVGIVVAAGGYAMFSLAQYSFWRIGVGMPLGLIGATIFLFKFYEFVLVIFKPSRIKAICKFCQRNRD